MTDTLYKRINRHAKYVAFTCGIPRDHQDDLTQEGAIAAIAAGETEWAAAFQAVHRAMLKYANRFAKHGFRPERVEEEPLSFVEYEDIQTSSYATPEEVLIFKEKVARVVGLSDRRIRKLRDDGLLALSV